MADDLESQNIAIYVLADDTYVLNLFNHFYVVLKLSVLGIKESPVRMRGVIHSQNCKKHVNIDTVLISTNALSGWIFW